MQLAQIILLLTVIAINGFLLIFHTKGEGKKPLIIVSRILQLLFSSAVLLIILFWK